MRRKYISMSLIIPALTTLLSSNEVLASTSRQQTTQNDNTSGTVVEKDIKVTNPIENTTVGSSIKGLMYEIDNSGQSVDVAILADAIGEKVKTTSDGIEVYLNGRKVSIVASTGCAYIDGALVYDKAARISGKYLIPKDVVQDKLGIFCDWDAFKIKREVDSKGNVKVTSISDQPSTSNNSNSSDKYEPVYDYDLRDYIDNYIDSHNISRITYNSNWTPDIERQMYAERAAKINEGWHTKDGKFYFLKNGVPVKGWYKDVITWYYFNSDGSMKTGWFKDGGNWYYFYDSGAMARNVCVNGYYLNDYGAMTNDVPANAPTGISYQELINRVRSIGYSHKRRYDAYSAGIENYAAGYEFAWYTKKYVDPLCNLVIRDDNTCYISSDFTDDDPDFVHDYNILLGWLFPTQKNEIFNKVNTAGLVKQTIYADGRVVEVSFHQGGINLKIKDQ